MRVDSHLAKFSKLKVIKKNSNRAPDFNMVFYYLAS